MDIIEVVVFFLASIVIGVMIFGVFSGWNYTRLYNDIKSSFFGNDAEKFEKISIEKFPRKILEIAEECNRYENEFASSVYIESSGLLNKTLFFNQIQEASLCNSVQSAELGCGTKETFSSFPQIKIPALISIKCTEHSLSIK